MWEPSVSLKDYSDPSFPPPFLSTYCILFFRLFFLHSVSASLVVFSSQTAFPVGYLSHSICFTDADVLISGKTTGRITTSLGNSFLCISISTHPSSYLSYRLLSKFHLSPRLFGKVLSLISQYKTLSLILLCFSPSTIWSLLYMWQFISPIQSQIFALYIIFDILRLILNNPNKQKQDISIWTKL